jgi:hypothetical protein
MSIAREIVEAWHSALNQGDVETMMALVDANVVVGGPRGTTQGAAVVREWFGRANVRLIPLAYFSREQTVVVEEEGEWLDPASRQVSGRQRVATHFVVKDGLITSIIRHDQIEDALSAAGLTTADKAS